MLCMYQPKIGDPSCLKTEVGGKQGHALHKKQCSKNYLMKKFVKELAPSPRQLLNGQGVQRISGLQKFEVRFGSWNVGSFCGRGTEVCDQLRTREVDMCYLQKIRWRGQGARFVGCRGRRYKLWWSENHDGIGGVGILVKEVRRKSDRVIAMVLVFEEEVMRVICACAPQVGRSNCEKD